MTDLVNAISSVMFLVLFFPAMNGLAVLIWYNVIVMWREEHGFIKWLALILAYVLTVICVLFDGALIFSIVNLVSMLT